MIDPTANVKALSEADNRRQDDLRDANSKRHEDLRHAQNKYYDSQLHFMEEIAKLRDSHAKELAEKEFSRLNAIRQVDQLAVTTAAQQTLTAVNTLATTAARDAETLRNALTTTAATIASQTAGIVAGITERIAALEKSNYESAGKNSYVDPMMAKLVASMDKLGSAQAVGAGQTQGISSTVGFIIAAVAFLGSLIAVGTSLFGGNRATVVTPPQIIYSQPAAGAK